MLLMLVMMMVMLVTALCFLLQLEFLPTTLRGFLLFLEDLLEEGLTLELVFPERATIFSFLLFPEFFQGFRVQLRFQVLLLTTEDCGNCSQFRLLRPLLLLLLLLRMCSTEEGMDLPITNSRRSCFGFP